VGDSELVDKLWNISSDPSGSFSRGEKKISMTSESLVSCLSGQKSMLG